jgi:hypothetical protein
VARGPARLRSACRDLDEGLARVAAAGILEVTEGAVFHDGLGELDVVRKALALYSADV